MRSESKVPEMSVKPLRPSQMLRYGSFMEHAIDPSIFRIAQPIDLSGGIDISSYALGLLPMSSVK